jgi:hypothetical protein
LEDCYEGSGYGVVVSLINWLVNKRLDLKWYSRSTTFISISFFYIYIYVSFLRVRDGLSGIFGAIERMFYDFF